jgi:VWFA-related protein
MCNPLSCFFFLLLGIPHFPATAQNPQTPSGDAVIRTTTHLVQVGVIVKDKNGQPVTGLTRNDFTILDGGQEQKIQLFSIETNKAPAVKDAEKLPPGTLTNRPSGFSGVPRNVTVVLIDAYNTMPSDHAKAREAILAFLEQIQPTDHVAIYALGSRLTVLQDFTNDSKALVEAVKKYKGSLSTAGAERAGEPAVITGTPAAGDALGQALAALNQGVTDMTETIANFQTNLRAEQSLRALEAIAGSLSGVPGRKNLIWVCGDFPLRIGYAEAGIDPKFRNLKEEMDRAARAVNAANIAVYPVDAGGLLGEPKVAAATGEISRSTGRTSRSGMNPSAGDGLAERISASATNSEMSIHAAMNDLADRTGGRASYHTNDLFTAIRQAVDDSQVTYMLSYAPDHNKWTGAFREIRVKVDKPGVQVLSRKGYLALPDIVSDDQQRRAALGQAAAAPVTSSGLGLKIHPTRQASTMMMNIEMDVHEISFEQKDGKYEALVDLLFVSRDGSGAVLDQVHQPADLSLSPVDYHKLEPTGIGLSLGVPIPKGAVKIRVVARDSSSGQVGSIDVPVTP